MNNTPLEDQVHDALHQRVDPLQHAPLTVTDVRRRAGRIQRRRRAAAGAAVAAVLAVAVPVGLSVTGPSQRTEVPPATHSPTLTGPVRIDPRTADTSATPPGVPLVDLTVPKVAAGSAELDLPKPYEQITRFMDGWVAVVNDEGVRTVEFLDQDLRVTDFATNSSPLAVAADGSRIAYATYDGNHWSVIDLATDGSRQERWTSLPPGPENETVQPVGFASDTEVVATHVDAKGSTSTFLADGESTEVLPWFVRAVSASAATGRVAGLTSVDGAESCSAVVEARVLNVTPDWETCDHQLGAFSADGSHIAAFSDVPDGPSPTVTVLDAATGEPVVDFEVTGARNRVVGIAPEVAWEDDEHLLATYTDGDQQYVVRLGLDGTVERVAGPVTVDSGQLALRLTPGHVE
jgi:hypothetical protein